ncbi:hypothetical protein LEP1GSC163_2894 [Leptospira santarosai str. CBC379]|nr:hypothetical protein LEP1GSC163_2894 [Leptospira santarosai str. CBC379]
MLEFKDRFTEFLQFDLSDKVKGSSMPSFSKDHSAAHLVR